MTPTIADRIFELRQRRGLTLLQVAGMVGSSDRIVWKYEDGEKLPSLARAHHWAKALGEDPLLWVGSILQHKLERAGLRGVRVSLQRRS